MMVLALLLLVSSLTLFATELDLVPSIEGAAFVDKSVPLPQGERYPVIPSIASDFDVFLSSRPFALSERPIDLRLDAPLPWFDDGRGLRPEVRQLARELGYE